MAECSLFFSGNKWARTGDFSRPMEDFFREHMRRTFGLEPARILKDAALVVASTEEDKLTVLQKIQQLKRNNPNYCRPHIITTNVAGELNMALWGFKDEMHQFEMQQTALLSTLRASQSDPSSPVMQEHAGAAGNGNQQQPLVDDKAPGPADAVVVLNQQQHGVDVQQSPQPIPPALPAGAGAQRC